MSFRAYEWVAFDGAPPGSDLALAIAPARWLVVAPPEAWLQERNRQEQVGGGVLFDVSGRWAPIDMTQHPRALDAAIPVELILRDREVASIWIHDCPVLIVRCNGETRVLTEASYAYSLRAMLARL